MTDKDKKITWIDEYKEFLQKSYDAIQQKTTSSKVSNIEIFSKKTPNNDDMQKILIKNAEDIKKQWEDLKSHWKEVKNSKALLWIVIWLLAANLATWYYEAHYRLNQIEIDYQISITDLKAEITVLKWENNSLKSDIDDLKEKNKINYIEIEKEVERQLDKKIIEFNFNILKWNK